METRLTGRKKERRRGYPPSLPRGHRHNSSRPSSKNENLPTILLCGCSGNWDFRQPYGSATEARAWAVMSKYDPSMLQFSDNYTNLLIPHIGFALISFDFLRSSLGVTVSSGHRH